MSVPSNAQNYFEIMLPIVSFDLLNDLVFYNDFIVYISRSEKEEEFTQTGKRMLAEKQNSTARTYDEVNISDQLQSLDYDTHNPLMNLGSIALWGMFYICKMIFVFVILLPLKCCCGNRVPAFKKYYDRYKTQLFWSDILSILFEAFLELLLMFAIY